jgi:hypothetical protein
MAGSKRWQRGAADIVSVMVGTLILAIVMAGTASSMVYGREALMRQEHYKAAAYVLRGKLEEVQAQLQIDQARDSRYLSAETYRPWSVESASDLGGVSPIVLAMSRDRIEAVDLSETGTGVDYFLITVHAQWRERDFADDAQTDPGQVREISFTTATVVRGLL